MRWSRIRQWLAHRPRPALGAWLVGRLTWLAETRWERWLVGAGGLLLVALAGARPEALPAARDGLLLVATARRATALTERQPAAAAELWGRLRQRRRGDLEYQERAASEAFQALRRADDPAQLQTLFRDPVIQSMLQRGAPGLAVYAAWTLLQNGHADEAVSVLRPALDRASSPGQRRLLALQLASALSTAGRPGEAEPLLLGLYEAHPRDPELRNALAWHYALVDQQLPFAERLITPVLRAPRWHLSSRSPARQARTASYLDTLAWIRYRQSRLPESRELLEQAVALTAAQPPADIAYHLAQVCFDLGDDRAAWEWCQHALEQAPRHREAQRLKGLLEGQEHHSIG